MKRNIIVLAVTLIALATLMAITGCGDNACPGGACVTSDGGAPTDFVARSIRFVPDKEEGNGNLRLVLASTEPERNTLSLKLVGDGFWAFGVTGRLTFDPKMVRVTGAEAGGALSRDGTRVVAAAAPTNEGAMFGFSRAGVRTAVSLSPSVGIGTLSFQVTKPGTTRIEWAPSRCKVYDADLKPQEPRCLGGTLIVE